MSSAAGFPAGPAPLPPSCLVRSRRGVVPLAVRRDERMRLLRPPAMTTIGASAWMLLEHRLDHRPRGFDRIFAREECAIAGHGVAQQPLVGCLLRRLFVDEGELIRV